MLLLFGIPPKAYFAQTALELNGVLNSSKKQPLFHHDFQIAARVPGLVSLLFFLPFSQERECVSSWFSDSFWFRLIGFRDLSPYFSFLRGFCSIIYSWFLLVPAGVPVLVSILFFCFLRKGILFHCSIMFFWFVLVPGLGSGFFFSQETAGQWIFDYKCIQMSLWMGCRCLGSMLV